MSKTAITLLVVGLAVAGFVAYQVVSVSRNKAPPVSGAATGPAAGSGIPGQAPNAYGSKITNTAGNVLGLVNQGLTAWGAVRGSKPGMT